MSRSISRILSALVVLAPASVLLLWWLGTLPAHPVPEVGREVFGNIPPAMVALFYVSVAGFLGVMFHLFALRARSWERGMEESRAGQWRRRLKRLEEGLRMKTLLEDPPAGVMHSMIYWGFLVLFAGTVTLEIDHLMPAGWKFLHGPVYLAYSAILDLFGLVFLGGLGWAVARRWGFPPYRIRTKTKPEDAWTLGLLIAIGVTGFAVEAARITLAGRPSYEVWSFVGYPLSLLVPEASAAGWHQALWWVHVISFLAFLVALPVTKLRHMVTSPANLFLSPRDRPKGAMKPMPNLMEVEDIETVGAAAVPSSPGSSSSTPTPAPSAGGAPRCALPT